MKIVVTGRTGLIWSPPMRFDSHYDAPADTAWLRFERPLSRGSLATVSANSTSRTETSSAYSTRLEEAERIDHRRPK